MLDEREAADFREIFSYPPRTSSTQEFGGNGDEEELKRFSHNMLPYYQRFMLATVNITDPTSASHPDRMRERGRLYRRARRHAGMLSVELAGDLQQANCPTNTDEISAFERGFIPATDLPEQFPTTFRQILISRLQRPTANN